MHVFKNDFFHYKKEKGSEANAPFLPESLSPSRFLPSAAVAGSGIGWRRRNSCHPRRNVVAYGLFRRHPPSPPRSLARSLGGIARPRLTGPLANRPTDSLAFVRLPSSVRDRNLICR